MVKTQEAWDIFVLQIEETWKLISEILISEIVDYP